MHHFKTNSDLHRRNEERDQGVPWAPPIRSKMGPIRSKIGDKRPKMGPFWGVVFHENTSRKSKFSAKGSDCFRHPKFYSSIAPMGIVMEDYFP